MGSGGDGNLVVVVTVKREVSVELGMGIEGCLCGRRLVTGEKGMRKEPGGTVVDVAHGGWVGGRAAGSVMSLAVLVGEWMADVELGGAVAGRNTSVLTGVI